MTDAKSTETPSWDTGLRRYVRVPSVIPVDFQLVSAKDGPLDSELRTGFTRDISENGLCLTIRHLPPALDERLQADELKDLRLILDVSVGARTLRVGSRVIWATPVPSGRRRRYWVGVEFDRLGAEDGKQLLHSARKAARRPRIMIGALSGFAALTALVLVLLWWRVSTHEEEIDVAQAKVERADERYRKAAAELESLTTDLLALSRELREPERPQDGPHAPGQVPGPDSAQAGAEVEDGGLGLYEPQLLAAAVDELRGDIDRLRRQLERLRDGPQVEAPASPTAVSTDEAAAKPSVPPTATEATQSPEAPTTKQPAPPAAPEQAPAASDADDTHEGGRGE